MSYLLKTSNYTASAGDNIAADTGSTGSFSILLPASPSAGDSIQIVDITASFGDHPLTIDGNGKLIAVPSGNAPTFVDSNQRDLIILIWATTLGIGGGNWLYYQLSTIFNTR